jgi:NAD(P)-dependent dehydrogenase (short-subunit alcohol dehydrogenase family)
LPPPRRDREPQDVAEAIAWLAEGARQVTGEILYIDGGLHIAAPR